MTGAHNKKKPAGLSILEILMSMGIFLVVMSSLLGVFGYIVKLQRQEMAMQASLENLRTTLEIMSRAIRQAKSVPPDTLDIGATTPCPNGQPNNTCIRFTHVSSEKGAVVYALDNNAIYETSASTGGNAVPITTQDVNIESLRFTLGGDDPEDLRQPTVTISMRIKSVANPARIYSLQTTVSLRDFQE